MLTDLFLRYCKLSFSFGLKTGLIQGLSLN